MGRALNIYENTWHRIPWLSDEDRFFLTDIFNRFPVVHEGFRLFSSTPAPDRIPLALKVLEKIPRTGLLRFKMNPGFREVLSTYEPDYNRDRCLVLEDIPAAPETILEHCAEGAEMAPILYADHPHVPWLREIMKYHDIIEAITTDFMPSAKITRAEKKQLEILGLELLTYNRHKGDYTARHVYHCGSMYARQCAPYPVMQASIQNDIAAIDLKSHPFAAFLSDLYKKDEPDLTHLARQAKDLDLTQMITRCARIVMYGHSRLTQEQTLHEMEEFWEHTDPRLKTQRGRRFFTLFNQHYQDKGVVDFKTCYTRTCQDHKACEKSGKPISFHPTTTLSTCAP